MDGMADIVTPAVTALAQAATTDAWKGLRTGIARILGRGDEAETRDAEKELDQTKDKIIAAVEEKDEARVERVKARLALQIQEFLDENPDEAESIRELLDGYDTNNAPAATVHNVVTKSMALFHGKAISGYNVNVTLPPEK